MPLSNDICRRVLKLLHQPGLLCEWPEGIFRTRGRHHERIGHFRAFFEEIKLDSLDEYQGPIDAIAKKLDSKYYDGDSLEGYVLVVGSVGRGTAVSGTSDLNMLYVLPPDVYKKNRRV